MAQERLGIEDVKADSELLGVPLMNSAPWGQLRHRPALLLLLLTIRLIHPLTYASACVAG